MHGYDLIFSRSGKAQKLYRVSPLLYPQDQTLNQYHLPKERDLPAHGLELRFQTFDFGFVDPGKIIPPKEMGLYQIPIGRNFIGTVLTGCSAAVATVNAPVAGTPGAQVNPAFLINFLQTHDGITRQWYSKDLPNTEALGTGADPMVLRDPILVPAGDMLTCSVRNLGNLSLQAQIVLQGGEF